MFATQVLPETLAENDTDDENNSGIVGLIIVDDKKFELKKGETKIGRDASLCSVVIENYTISKVHAIIESEGVDDTFIYDIGSTNQTKLGKKILKPHCRYKLDNNSQITLGNVIAKFILPPDISLEADEGTGKPNSGNLDEMTELVDIFDVPTQVTAIPQLKSNEVPAFEKLQNCFKLFKIPNPVPSRESKSFDEPSQLKSDSDKTKSKAVFCNGSFEDSAIFSLGTQCQVYEPPVVQQNTVKTSDNNKNSETEALKSLLNDGQDDILCSFMASHSPKEQNMLVKEIKTEIVHLDEVFDAPTQAPMQQTVEVKRDLRDSLQNKDLIEDFPTTVSSQPCTTSTPIRRFNLSQPDKSDSCTQHLEEEDFIMTQEFHINNSGSIKHKSPSNFFKDTQPHVDEQPTTEPKNEEDMILTQSFEVPSTHNKEPSVVIPESEELNASQEDFIGTQIFPLKNQPEIQPTTPGTPDREVSNLNLTQRSTEDDFIATQIFEEGKNRSDDDDNNSDRNENDDEDFIATQTVELPTSFKFQQKPPQTGKEASRESSPDLLSSDTFIRNFEDRISTQVFEPSEDSSRSKHNVPPIVPEPADSSGDETESDLEIILEKGDGQHPKCFKSEISSLHGSPIREENNDSNSSYVFELGSKTHSEGVVADENSKVVQLSDSDATDCEEMTIPAPIKQEPKEIIQFEDTQVLTLTLPDNYAQQASCSNEICRAESPKFEIEEVPMSPLSLEMPNTQDIESAMNRILESEKENKETPEVGKINWNITPSKAEPSESLIGSPLKRLRDSSNNEVIPIKKFKPVNLGSSEKQFSKLVQTHDITQIQPCRTRNSLRNLTENKPEIRLGKNINERPTSRRNTNPKRNGKNGDITPYLTRRTVRKQSPYGRNTSPNENQLMMVLRSSKKTSGSPTNSNPNGARNTRRNSKTKNEYFSNPCVNIIFTGFECELLEEIISELGGKKTNDLTTGQVVVTDKVRRTVKVLCAIGLGIPITSPQWLLSSREEKTFLNPWNFILKDDDSEIKWDFELKTSLEKSKKTKLLHGFSVFATRSTKPPVKDFLAIVESCGGTPLFEYPDAWPKKTIFASCLEDKKWWPRVKSKNVKIVHYEFILNGVLRQKIDFRRFRLT